MISYYGTFYCSANDDIVYIYTYVMYNFIGKKLMSVCCRYTVVHHNIASMFVCTEGLCVVSVINPFIFST